MACERTRIELCRLFLLSGRERLPDRNAVRPAMELVFDTNIASKKLPLQNKC